MNTTIQILAADIELGMIVCTPEGGMTVIEKLATEGEKVRYVLRSLLGDFNWFYYADAKVRVVPVA